MLIANTGAFFAAARKWRNPYVTDGLVAMWDGEWNAGGGVHDANPNEWVDISGHGYNAVLSQVVGTGSLTFNDKYVLKEGYITYPKMNTGIDLTDGIHTIEACMVFVTNESQNRHSGVGVYPVAILNNSGIGILPDVKGRQLRTMRAYKHWGWIPLSVIWLTVPFDAAVDTLFLPWDLYCKSKKPHGEDEKVQEVR